MGVRETLNKQPMIATGATIGIIVIALAFIVYQVNGGGHPRIPTESYYTVDDGATYFSDDIKLIPPFDHDGKQAVKADVFKCAGAHAFVGYLERYTPAAKKILDGATAKPPGDTLMMDQAASSGLEVKAPLTGDKGWQRAMTPYANKITLVHCTDASADLPEQVFP